MDELIRQKKRLHKIAKHRNRDTDWVKFRQLRNRVTTSVRKAKYDYYCKLDEKLNTINNSKMWWKLVNKYLKKEGRNDKSFPPLHHNDTVYDDVYDKANILNNYFVDQARVDFPDKDLPDLVTKMLTR